MYGITWLTGLGQFSADKLTSGVEQQLGGVELSFIASVLLLSTVGVLVNFLGALGEEIGWRGFLVPELAHRWGFTRVALTTGIIWAVYHYPLMLLAGYRGDNPLWYSVLFFTVMAVSLSFVFAWLRLRSGSLWTAVILHAAHNMFVQALFGGATVDAGGTEYITSEFGAGMAIMYVLLGFWAWKRRSQLPVGPSGESGLTSN